MYKVYPIYNEAQRLAIVQSTREHIVEIPAALRVDVIENLQSPCYDLRLSNFGIEVSFPTRL